VSQILRLVTVSCRSTEESSKFSTCIEIKFIATLRIIIDLPSYIHSTGECLRDIVMSAGENESSTEHVTEVQVGPIDSGNGTPTPYRHL
jgi:hypothetical protein